MARNAAQWIDDQQTPITPQEDLVRAAALAIVTLRTTLLAGCGAAPGPAGTVDVPQAGASAAPSAPVAPSAQTSDRGNLVKKLGETAAFGPMQLGQTTPTPDEMVVKFVIDKITVGAKCTSQFAQKPQNGTFLKVDIRAETKPTMPPNSGFAINPFDFTTVGSDGITESSLTTGPALSCIDPSQQLTPNFSPGSKYRGSLVLDTKNTSGVLVFKPGVMAATGGWEWQYPA